MKPQRSWASADYKVADESKVWLHMDMRLTHNMNCKILQQINMFVEVGPTGCPYRSLLFGAVALFAFVNVLPLSGCSMFV